jgi:hypothetical protein
MTRNTTFYAVSSTLAAVVLSASSTFTGAGAGKIKVTAGGSKQIQGQQGQGDLDRPYIIGGAYNGSGNGTPSAGARKPQLKSVTHYP